MGIFLAFFVVVSLVCLILLIKIKLKQRRSQVPFTTSQKLTKLNLKRYSLFCTYLTHLDIVSFSSIQSSMNRMAIQALEKMETRKFKAKIKSQRESSCSALDSLSSSSTSDCAICLEKYIDGEVTLLFSPTNTFCFVTAVLESIRGRASYKGKIYLYTTCQTYI